jgi:N-acyl-D-aspartate/D-glutamate deacylase
LVVGLFRTDQLSSQNLQQKTSIHALRRFFSTFGELEKIPLALNMGTCLGHGTLRCAVMGFEARKATDREMEERGSEVLEKTVFDSRLDSNELSVTIYV